MNDDDTIELNIRDPILTPQQFKELRNRLRLSQRKLAELLGVHRRTVESYETPVGQQNHRQVSRAVGLELMRLSRERV